MPRSYDHHLNRGTIKEINKMDKQIIKYFKIYVIGSLVAFAIIVGFWGYLVVSKAFQSQKLIESQIEYQNKATEEISKPKIIEQRYITK